MAGGRIRYLGAWFLVFILTACTSTPIPPDALQNLQPGSAAVIWSSGLYSVNSVVPKNSSVVVFEAKHLNGDREHRAFLQRPQQPATYLGPLTKQFPDAPLETLLVKVGEDRFIVGWVASSVQGTVDSVMLIPSATNKADYMKGAKSGITNHRVFMFPISQNEAGKWQSIAQIEILTKESLKRGSQNFSVSGAAWQQTYTPPVSTTALWSTVR